MSAHRNVSHAADEAQETSTRKRARKAPCWEHFDKINPRMGTTKVRGREAVVDIVTTKCKHCLKEFEHTSSKGTTHLNNHVKSCPELKAARERTDALANGSVDDTDRLDILLAKAIIQHIYPFNKELYSVFQQFIPSLRPGYKLPSQKRIGELFRRIFSDEQNKLRQILNSVSSRISLSISEHDTYLYMTACFIDDSWNWQQRFIGSLEVESIDFGDEGFLSCDHYIMKESRLLNIVTMDDQAVRFLSYKNQYYNRKKILKSLDIRLCKDLSFDDIAIIDDKEDEDDVMPIPLNECLFGASSLYRYNFHIKCAIKVIDEAAEIGRSLFTDLYRKIFTSRNVPSSWIGAFPYVKMWHEKNEQDVFNEEEHYRLTVLKECWSCFHYISKLLNEFNYVSSGVFFVKLCEIQSLLKNQLIHMDEEINSMSQEMNRILDVYWGSHKILLSVTCFLDPRYKITKIKEYYSLIFKNDGESTKFRAVISYLMKLYARMEVSNYCSFEECEDELERYLSEECLQGNDDKGNNKFDVLKWWKGNERFKILKRMAKDILGIPLVSTAKAPLVHSFIQEEQYRNSMFDEEEDYYQWYVTGGDALCLYVWLKEENEERVENTHREST